MFDQLAELKLRQALKNNNAVGIYGFVNSENKVQKIYAKKSPYEQLQIVNDYNGELIALIGELKADIVNLQSEISLLKK
jgi:hypothetical protein